MGRHKRDVALGEIKTEILSWEELILGDLSGHSHQGDPFASI